MACIIIWVAQMKISKKSCKPNCLHIQISLKGVGGGGGGGGAGAGMGEGCGFFYLLVETNSCIIMLQQAAM